MTRRILIVDDEAEIRRVLAAYLQREGFEVVEAATGADALNAARSDIDIMLLDVGLPDIDGLEVLRILRATSDLYVILVTARADEVDKLVGLSVGADDYITKPFSPREVVARVKAVLRRMRPTAPETPTNSLHFDGLHLDADKREVTTADGPVHLSTLDFDLLWALASSPGRVFSRAQLLEQVWGYDFYGDERVVDVHIRSMRASLGDDAVNPPDRRNGTRRRIQVPPDRNYGEPVMRLRSKLLYSHTAVALMGGGATYAVVRTIAPSLFDKAVQQGNAYGTKDATGATAPSTRGPNDVGPGGPDGSGPGGGVGSDGGAGSGNGAGSGAGSPSGTTGGSGATDGSGGSVGPGGISGDGAGGAPPAPVNPSQAPLDGTGPGNGAPGGGPGSGTGGSLTTPDGVGGISGSGNGLGDGVGGLLGPGFAAPHPSLRDSRLGDLGVNGTDLVSFAGGNGTPGPGPSAALREQFASSVETSLLIGTFIGVIAAIILGFFLARGVLAPLDRVRLATRSIARGRYDVRVATTSDEDLNGLATDVNSLAEAIGETEQRRMRLIGEVAHELRTPLTVLDGSIEGMIDGIIPTEPEDLARLSDEVRRMRRLADDLSLLSRAEEDRLTMTFEDVDLSDVVASASERLRPQAEDADLTLTVFSSAPLGRSADAQRISQVVTNLIAMRSARLNQAAPSQFP